MRAGEGGGPEAVWNFSENSSKVEQRTSLKEVSLTLNSVQQICPAFKKCVFQLFQGFLTVEILTFVFSHVIEFRQADDKK